MFLLCMCLSQHPGFLASFWTPDICVFWSLIYGSHSSGTLQLLPHFSADLQAASSHLPLFCFQDRQCPLLLHCVKKELKGTWGWEKWTFRFQLQGHKSQNLAISWSNHEEVLLQPCISRHQWSQVRRNHGKLDWPGANSSLWKAYNSTTIKGIFPRQKMAHVTSWTLLRQRLDFYSWW